MTNDSTNGPIEDKLRALADCGFRLKEQFNVDDLAAIWGREALDEPGYNLALVCLGMSEEEPPWRHHCENLWHFDTECIEGDGSYVRIAERMAEMSQGALKLTDLEDHIDLDEGRAWLRFQCGGSPIHIECAIQDDWVDTDVFQAFIDLLARHDPNKLFIFYDLGGQDCIVGCTTRDNFAMLKKVIRDVQPLT